jgi:mono/diheme cytochrome c family protein
LSRASRATAVWCIALATLLVLVVGVRGGATAQAPRTPPAGQVEPPSRGDDHQHGGNQHDDHAHEEAGAPHVHAPVPPEYRTAHVPSSAWTNTHLIARGKELYATRCAVCHGEQGDGKGPAAAGVPVKPPSFRDIPMVNQMAGNYWFWRVSEGGLVEPFKSLGSVMPAWKNALSPEDRWAVIAYTHRLSGHEGPHVTSEHPEMLMAGHARHDAATSVKKPDASHGGHGSGAPAHKH